MTAEQVKKTVRLAVLTALSVIGRSAFAFLPFFKPVSAVTVIAGMTMGPGWGFACGALSALISNLFFGQGLWTPFQMLAWGTVGLLAGLASPLLKKSRWMMIPCGILSGLIFSLMMDVFTALWMDGGFHIERYAALVVTAIPVTAVYMVSDTFFLMLMWKKAKEM